MNAGFIKFLRSEVAEELMRYPTSFTLLAQIAFRARREVPKINPFHMEVGEAMIGDFATIGLSRQQYRIALDNLKEWGYVTTRATNKGTIAKLCNSEVYDINSTIEQPTKEPPNKPAREPHNNHQENQPTNHTGTTNKNVKKEDKKLLGQESFEIFWQGYDKKVGKPKAEKKWASLSEQEIQAALQALPAYVASTPEKKFRKDPATWLNGSCWQDETITPTAIAAPPELLPFPDNPMDLWATPPIHS